MRRGGGARRLRPPARVARFLAVLRRVLPCCSRGVFRVEWRGRCAAGWACPAALRRGRIPPPDETQATPARAIPPPRETQATPARPQQYDSSKLRHAGAAAVTPARTTGHAGAVPVSHVPARPFVWGHARGLPAVTTLRGQEPHRHGPDRCAWWGVQRRIS